MSKRPALCLAGLAASAVLAAYVWMIRRLSMAPGRRSSDDLLGEDLTDEASLADLARFYTDSD